MEIFGYKVWKDKPGDDKKSSGQLAFALDQTSDADAVIQDERSWTPGAQGGVQALDYTLSQVPEDEIQLIKQYRAMALNSDIDEAIAEIKNEIFIFSNPGKRPFDLTFIEDSKVPESLREKIHEAFVDVYNIMDFGKKGLKYFEDWYVDSKLYLHKVVDENKPREGIKRVIPIDPLCIRKIRQLPMPDRTTGLYDPDKVRDFFLYSPSTQNNSKTPNVTEIAWNARLHGMQIMPQAISSIDSGLYDRQTTKCIGYLRKTIVPFNQLKGMEDAMMVYRMSRAPSRRAFYIDTGSLSKTAGEQYMKDLMGRYGSKVSYDPSSGSMVSRKNIMSITEDYWLARRDGKSTEIQTIDGMDTTNILEEVNYYRNGLWRSLGVPRNRFGQESSSFNFGRGAEIDRDEYRFKKFIGTLRNQFMQVFMNILETQLVLTKVIEVDEWNDILDDVVIAYEEDNSFTEWKETEVLNSRIATLREADDIVGKYVSREWAAKNILRMTEHEFKAEVKAIEAERKADADAGIGPDGAALDAGGEGNPDAWQAQNPAPPVTPEEPPIEPDQTTET